MNDRECLLLFLELLFDELGVLELLSRVSHLVIRESLRKDVMERLLRQIFDSPVRLSTLLTHRLFRLCLLLLLSHLLCLLLCLLLVVPLLLLLEELLLLLETLCLAHLRVVGLLVHLLEPGESQVGHEFLLHQEAALVVGGTHHARHFHVVHEGGAPRRHWVRVLPVASHLFHGSLEVIESELHLVHVVVAAHVLERVFHFVGGVDFYEEFLVLAI